MSTRYKSAGGATRWADFGGQVLRFSLLALALLLVACGQVSYSVEDHIERAENAYADGDLRTAIIEVKNALQQDPAQSHARRLLGLYSLEMGDAGSAESELTKALELGEDPDLIRLPLARAWLNQGRYEQVINETQLESSFAEDHAAEAMTLRAYALLGRGDVSAAGESLEKALDLAPGSPEALAGKAWVKLLSGDVDAARKSLAQSLESDPGFSDAWELLGDIERQGGQLAEAEVAYSRAIESASQPIWPILKRAMTRISLEDLEGAGSDLQSLRSAQQEPAVIYVQGLLALEQDRFDDAMTAFQEVLARDPSFRPADFYLGASHYALGNWRQAEQHLTRYVAEYPTSTHAAHLLALTRLAAGDASRAEATLESVLRSDPDHVGALAVISDLYLSQGRVSDALHHMRKVAALEPDSAVTRARLGMTLMQQGQRNEALQEFEAAFALDPSGLAPLEVSVAINHIQAGEFQRALEAVERLRGVDSVDPALLANLEGVAHLGLGDTLSARAAFRSGLEDAPVHPALTLNLAMLELREGNREAAIELLEALQSSDPGEPQSATRLAALALQEGRTSHALSLLGDAIRYHPEATEPFLMLARIQLETGEGAESVQTLQEGLDAHPDDPQFLFALADVQERLGKFAEASVFLSRLAEIQPENAEAQFRLARTLTLSGNQDGVEDALRLALELDPKHVPARVTLVRQLSLAGEMDEARSLFQPLLENHPERADVIAQRAWFHLQSREYDEAASAYSAALAREPRRVWLLEQHQALMRAGETDAAVSKLVLWLETRPGDRVVRHLLGSVLTATGQLGQALDLYEAQLQREPDDVIALNNLAWLLREQDTAQAVHYAERARSLAPDHPAVLDTLGVVYRYSGDPARAVVLLTRATELAPDDPKLKLHLAQALVADGKDQQARTLLASLLSRTEPFPEREQAESLFAEIPPR